jgi:hypothetical protein
MPPECSHVSFGQLHVEANEKTPQISLDCVMKAAGLIESMGARRLLARKTIE